MTIWWLKWWQGWQYEDQSDDKIMTIWGPKWWQWWHFEDQSDDKDAIWQTMLAATQQSLAILGLHAQHCHPLMNLTCVTFW